jgi:hypothetical protein
MLFTVIGGEDTLISPAATSGYPHTIPCGQVYDLPVGLLFGLPYTEGELIGLDLLMSIKKKIDPALKPSFIVSSTPIIKYCVLYNRILLNC